MRKMLCVLGACALLALGCRSISVHKHDPVVYTPPGQTNVVCIVEGGWDASYYSYGVWTSFGSLGVTIGTNVVSLTLNDLNSDMFSSLSLPLPVNSDSQQRHCNSYSRKLNFEPTPPILPVGD